MKFRLVSVLSLITFALFWLLNCGGDSSSEADCSSEGSVSSEYALDGISLISNIDYESRYPEISLDNLGNALVVWIQYDTSDGSSIWANRYTFGGCWGTAEQISSNIRDAGSLKIVIDGAGNAIAAWVQHEVFHYRNENFYYQSIWTNRYSVGSGWGTAEQIFSSINKEDFDEESDLDLEPPNTAIYSAKIIIDIEGNAFAVWNQVYGYEYRTWVSRYTVDNGWGVAEQLSNYAHDPLIAMDSDGNTFVLWATTHGIWANRYTVGGSWGTVEQISPENLDARSPKIVIDDAGNALVVWNQYDTSYGRSIWANRYTVDNGWGSAELIESDNNTGQSLGSQIVMDSEGNAVTIWDRVDSNSLVNLWSNRYSVGSGWGVAEIIVNNDKFTVERPIAVDTAGNIHAIFNGEDSVSVDQWQYNIWASRYTVGIGWGIPESIAPELPLGTVENPNIVIDGAGNALVIWMLLSRPNSPDGMQKRAFWANRYSVGSGWGSAGIITVDFESYNFDSSIASNELGQAFLVWSGTSNAQENSTNILTFQIDIAGEVMRNDNFH